MDKDGIRYYPSFDYDFEDSGNQAYCLPSTYRYRRSRILSELIYGVALVFSTIYCRLFLHVRIRGSEKLREAGRQGFFLYGNHTQPVGDVFNPALAAFPRRIYTVVSPANLALPVIGRLLPYLGALPIPDTVAGMREFTGAVRMRLEQGHPVVIYPEAHVWQYCPFIRPFSATSFKFPVSMNKPVFCFTLTYQKRRFCRRPTATMYVDGPFERGEGSPRQQAATLQKAVTEAMKARCEAHTTYTPIRYSPLEEQPKKF